MDRSNFVVQDKYGVDPLADDLIDKILAISSYSEHTVTPSEESNPQLLADTYYSNVELYFIILYYNGIGNSFALARGAQIKIPSRNEVFRLLADKAFQRKADAPKTMEI